MQSGVVLSGARGYTQVVVIGNGVHSTILFRNASINILHTCRNYRIIINKNTKVEAEDLRPYSQLQTHSFSGPNWLQGTKCTVVGNVVSLYIETHAFNLTINHQ